MRFRGNYYRMSTPEFIDAMIEGAKRQLTLWEVAESHVHNLSKLSPLERQILGCRGEKALACWSGFEWTSRDNKGRGPDVGPLEARSSYAWSKWLIVYTEQFEKHEWAANQDYVLIHVDRLLVTFLGWYPGRLIEQGAADQWLVPAEEGSPRSERWQIPRGELFPIDELREKHSVRPSPQAELPLGH